MSYDVCYEFLNTAAGFGKANLLLVSNEHVFYNEGMFL